MMIGLSDVNRCGDPTCDPTKEICCPGQQQVPPVKPSSDPGTGGTAAVAPVVTGSTTTTSGSGTPVPGTVAPPGFVEGLKAWQSPSSALALLPHIGAMFSAAPAATAGYLLVPLAAIGGILYYLSTQKGR